MMKSRYFTLLIPLFLFIFAETVSASGEARLKSDVDYAVPLKGNGSSLVIHPMLQTEQRFRSTGLSKSKVFAGIRVNISPRVRIQGYYGYQEDVRPKSKRDHRIVIDLTVRHIMNRIVLKERTRSEWRSNPGYFRYRQYLELLYHSLSDGWLPGLRRRFAGTVTEVESFKTISWQGWISQ